MTDAYWFDFIRGNDLSKYGEITIVQEWFVDYLTLDVAGVIW